MVPHTFAEFASCLFLACCVAAGAPAAAADPTLAPIRVVDANGKVVGRYAFVNDTSYDGVGTPGTQPVPAALASFDGGLVAIPLGPAKGAGLTWAHSLGWTLYFDGFCQAPQAFLQASSALGQGTLPAFLRLSSDGFGSLVPEDVQDKLADGGFDRPSPPACYRHA